MPYSVTISNMEIILRGYHDKKNDPVKFDLLELGRSKLPKTIYDGERDWPVMLEGSCKSPFGWVRVSSYKVIYPDGKERHPVIVDIVLKTIRK